MCDSQLWMVKMRRRIRGRMVALRGGRGREKMRKKERTGEIRDLGKNWEFFFFIKKPIVPRHPLLAS